MTRDIQPRERSWPVNDQAGFTVVELIIYLVLSVVILSALYGLVINQNRMYTKEREVVDVRGTLRTTAEVLAVELRMTAASEGDLVAIDTDSVTLRSVQGSGVVCGANGTGQLGLFAVSGEFFATADDSVMIYATGGSGSGDDGWMLTGVAQVLGAGGGSVSSCDNGGGTEEVLAVDTLDGTAFSGVNVGNELRAYRRVTYRAFQSDGRWWLGRKVGDLGSYELLAGPLMAPSDSGLALRYYDTTGVETAVPADVRRVEILLRGESLKYVRQAGGTLEPQTDSIRMSVSLRG